MSTNSGRKKSPATTGDSFQANAYVTTTGAIMPGITGYVNSIEIREGMR